MEKLIELLNEYGEYDLVDHNGEICKWNTDDEGEINVYTDYTNNIISKKFGFIGWLVENDKIDRDKVLFSFHMTERDGLGTYYGHGVEDYQRMLMLLAILDEPIKYLCEILK